MQATEAQEPSFRRLIARQNKIREILEEILKLAIQIKLGLLPTGVTPFSIRMPKIAIRDFQRLSGAFSKATGAILNSLQAGIMDRDEARKFILTLAEQMGLGAELAKEFRKEV